MEDRGFETVDKRSSHAAEQTAGQAPDAGDEDYGPEFQMPPLPDIKVEGILRMTVSLLHECAWAALGLVPNPATGQIEKDLGEARRAIDVIADLAKHVEPLVDAEEKRELQNLISNLRINYVQQSSRP